MTIWDEAEKIVKQERKYVKKTGLCVDCKIIPVIKKELRCFECEKIFRESIIKVKIK